MVVVLTAQKPPLDNAWLVFQKIHALQRASDAQSDFRASWPFHATDMRQIRIEANKSTKRFGCVKRNERFQIVFSLQSDTLTVS